MAAQPARDGFGLPVQQQVDYGITFEIHENGTVAMPAAPSPIIDSEHARPGFAAIGKTASTRGPGRKAFRHGVSATAGGTCPR
jgi:hypothetical protein